MGIELTIINDLLNIIILTADSVILVCEVVGMLQELVSGEAGNTRNILFNTQYLENWSVGGDWSVLTLGSLCLPCFIVIYVNRRK